MVKSKGLCLTGTVGDIIGLSEAVLRAGVIPSRMLDSCRRRIVLVLSEVGNKSNYQHFFKEDYYV